MPLQNQKPRAAPWKFYFLLTYAALIAHAALYLREMKLVDATTGLFAIAAILAYGALYVLPVLGLAGLSCALLSRPDAPAHVRPAARLAVAVIAVVSAAAAHMLLHVDLFIFRLYGFHLNGFVWNLVFTRGGIESLGGGSATTLWFAFDSLLYVLLQTACLGAAFWRSRRRALGDASPAHPRPANGAPPRRRRLTLAMALAWTACLLLAQGSYAWARIRGHAPIIAASNVVPLFIPISFTRLAGDMGARIERDAGMVADVTDLNLRYPLQPIQRVPVERPFNIVWLVAESLRADMLAPDIMPASWKLAKQSSHFLNHYSGGNGTRMGMFAMFYGLYGNYWFSFLAQRRGPVLFDVLLDMNYQMEMFTSAAFTYPEFDKTIFARIPSDHLHEFEAEPRWRRDQHNVDSILDFIDKRDPARPFMTFMFFESPHARYYFPAETAIRKPYADNFDYATMDVSKDMPLVFNRYINSCHYLDSQIERILHRLEQRGLLDRTIVIITGDHGEEFMEKGRYGHNSAFSQEQTRPPLVLWVPGRPAREITHMTSHLDLPATILPLLGVTNPPQDYSLGFDLLGDAVRPFTVLSDWNELGIFTGTHKAVFHIGSYGFTLPLFTTQDDAPLPDGSAFYAQHRDTLMRVMSELKRFSR